MMAIETPRPHVDATASMPTKERQHVTARTPEHPRLVRRRGIVRTMLLASALWLVADANASAADWPRMAAWDSTVVVADADHPRVRRVIPDAQGEPAYTLSCGNFDTEDQGFDYSGDFECRLMSIVPDPRYSTLLTENPAQTRDWESRGRFFVEDLQGACAADARVGAHRRFQLRGMALRLDVDQVRTRLVDGRTRLASLVLHVQVAPDAVRTPIARATGYAALALNVPGLDTPRPCAASRQETAAR